MIEVQNLFKNYQQGDSSIPVLKGINFSIISGEQVAVLGQSGSGKSTLLSLMAGLDSPTNGKVIVDRQDLALLTEDQLASFRSQNIGIVFQQYHLIDHLTALENVSLPLDLRGEKNSVEKAKDMLSRVGLSHRYFHLPRQLSGGECQRVAIARALVVKPKLLLADEPSGSLDTKTGDQVMKLLFDLVNEFKTTTILVTHNTELARNCARQIHLVNGQVEENEYVVSTEIRP